jgi:hypothetical protein
VKGSRRTAHGARQNTNEGWEAIRLGGWEAKMLECLEAGKLGSPKSEDKGKRKRFYVLCFTEST